MQKHFCLNFVQNICVYYINITILDFSKLNIHRELWNEVFDFVSYSIDKSNCRRSLRSSEMLSSIDW